MAEESDAEKPPAQESFLSQPVCGHSELPYTIPPAKLLQNSDAQGQLTAAVDELLDQLQSKFDNVSKEVFGKLDDMTRRLDELEASLTSSGGGSATAPTN
jgi:heat shock factor-binding protein 1